MINKTLFPADAEFLVLPEATTGERSHYGRSKWPPGPWHKEEYDKVVWVDPDTNLDCMLVRGPMGSWCGYVGVPEGHPWHGVKYSGCINRHAPLTLERRKEKAREWLEEAKAKDAKDGTNHTRLAELALEGLEGDGFMTHMDQWECLGYDKDDRCPTPEGNVDVHGGLTYSDACQKSGPVCHYPLPGRPEHVWWFGYDANHYGDLAPGMLANSAYMRERLKDDPTDHDLFRDHLTYNPEEGTNDRGESSYKNIVYCKGEVDRLALQLGLKV